MKKQGWLWTEEFIWHKKNSYPGKWPNRFREGNDEFFAEYFRILNLFTQEFTNGFCADGKIDWGKLVQFNSGKK